MDQYGRWTEPAAERGVVVVNNNVLAVNVALVCGDLEFTVADGCVTAVTLTETRRENESQHGEDLLVMNQSCCMAATLALAGSQREINCFNYDVEDWLALWDDRWDDFELDYRGVHISQTEESSGYSGSGQARTALAGQEQSFTRTVTISFTDG